MTERQSTPNIARLILVVALSLPVLAAGAASHAAALEPSSSEPRPSGRRTAARAIERRSSTHWLSDVAERLRVLEEHTDRAATSSEKPHGALVPAQLPERNLR